MGSLGYPEPSGIVDLAFDALAHCPQPAVALALARMLAAPTTGYVTSARCSLVIVTPAGS